MPFSDSKLDTSWSFYQSSLSISFFQTYLDKKKVELETVEVNNINLLSKPGFIFNYLYVCVKNVGVWLKIALRNPTSLRWRKNCSCLSSWKKHRARCCLKYWLLLCVFISGQIIEMAIVNPQLPDIPLYLRRQSGELLYLLTRDYC